MVAVADITKFSLDLKSASEAVKGRIAAEEIARQTLVKAALELQVKTPNVP
jgi:hypothetical protein